MVIMSSEQIISGEKFMDIADISILSSVIGNAYFMNCDKNFILIQNVPKSYYNPRIVYVYGHDIIYFSSICHRLMNPYVLITHNSDANIIQTDISLRILHHSNCIRWYGQNVAFHHPRLQILPIGLARRYWPHGNLDVLSNKMQENVIKMPGSIHFQFTVNTNPHLRNECKQILLNKGLTWLPEVPFQEHIDRLSTYQFCICPQGNGLDTHRLWECFYLGVIPILISSPHIEIIRNNIPLPMIIVRSWNELPIQHGTFTTIFFNQQRFEMRQDIARQCLVCEPNDNKENNSNYCALTMNYWKQKIIEDARTTDDGDIHES